MATPNLPARTTNIIGEKSFFEGRFLINGTIQINGKFEGQILKVDTIQVGKTGKVKTDIVASSIVVEGVVVGNIQAHTRVMLLPTARMLGDIHTPELIIHNGVILEGKCHISTDMTHPARETIIKLYNSEE
ncbi:MAG: cell division protein [Spirochaetes bacterium GWF1_51_8]|nr:MAG: cell division protein [Spirochaetes bacterium GWF1_51_8]